MSHYTLLVITPPGKDEDCVEAMLAPFDENNEVAPYPSKCHCVNMIASSEAHSAAEKKIGNTIDQLRGFYRALPDNDRPVWSDYIKDFAAAREAAEKNHPLFEKPNASCESCKGSGILESTYNPDSKWDWWTFGGRWNGMLFTKVGDWVNAAKVADIDWEAMKRTETKRAVDNWDKAQNASSVTRYWEFGIENETREDYIARSSAFSTFGVLSPDGVWHERGKMGWWATVHNETESELEWSLKFFERFIKTADPESTIAVVDCHI